MLKALYVIVIGLLFAGFIGFGVFTFYRAPDYPDCQMYKDSALGQTIEDQNCKQQQEAYYEQDENYSRNLSIIYLTIAVIVVAISLFGIGSIPVIGDGLTLGGIFVLFTGLGISFGADDEIFRFLAITAGLIIILLISYWKFVRRAPEKVTQT